MSNPRFISSEAPPLPFDAAVPWFPGVASVQLNVIDKSSPVAAPLPLVGTPTNTGINVNLYANDAISGFPANLTVSGGKLEVTSAGAATGASSSGNVGAASAQIKAPNANAKWLTVQNTHATQTLYLSFANPATVNDIALAPGASITFGTAPVNGLFGIGSGAATTFAIMELS